MLNLGQISSIVMTPNKEPLESESRNNGIQVYSFARNTELLETFFSDYSLHSSSLKLQVRKG